jgi:hypothetical protein
VARGDESSLDRQLPNQRDIVGRYREIAGLLVSDLGSQQLGRSDANELDETSTRTVGRLNRCGILGKRSLIYIAANVHVARGAGVDLRIAVLHASMHLGEDSTGAEGHGWTKDHTVDFVR